LGKLPFKKKKKARKGRSSKGKREGKKAKKKRKRDNLGHGSSKRQEGRGESGSKISAARTGGVVIGHREDDVE